jgi:hypothetical protein
LRYLGVTKPPGLYGGTAYSGVDEFGTMAGAAAAKHLVILGWERAGALITLFAPPLATPKFLFTSSPDAKPGDDSSDAGPSQRPYETLTTLKAKLNLTIDATHRKSQFAEMVTSALACDGAVLAWQHEDIALKTNTGNPGISAEILTQTGTPGTLNVPTSWPIGPAGARNDLVFVFDRPTGREPICGVTPL